MKSRPQPKPPKGLSLGVKIAIAVAIAAAAFGGYKAATPGGASASPSNAPGAHPLSPVASEAHHAQGVRYISDTRVYTLGPGRAMEFMYQLNAGGAMVYGWKASGEVEFDLHNEPHNNPDGAQTIEQGNNTERHGSYVAPFDGLHGWFWQNHTQQAVTVELTASGFFRGGRIFHENGTSEPVNVP